MKRKPDYYGGDRSSWYKWTLQEAKDKAAAFSDKDLVEAYGSAARGVGGRGDHIIGDRYDDNEYEATDQIEEDVFEEELQRRLASRQEEKP